MQAAFNMPGPQATLLMLRCRVVQGSSIRVLLQAPNKPPKTWEGRSRWA